ncbi:hypothetical protein SEA_SISKO_67 [Gordonia phage Sisko]|nr:hypothetical protein SEA_SISKO_67 [Gordonia phage Sisko]
MSDEPRRWTAEHPDGGRVDVNGTEWFACDPYPTWYRWERGDALTGQLIVGGWRNTSNIEWPVAGQLHEVLTDVLHDAGAHISRSWCERTAREVLADERISITVVQP